MLAVIMLGGAAACAPRPLLERAIRARGGPLESIVRSAEAEVYTGFAGTWRWRIAFLVPDRYAWTIGTTAEPNHYVFDGSLVRAFVGGQEVAADASRGAPLRSHARFTAVTGLDVLRLPGAQVAELPPGELPAGAARGLAVVLADDGARYRLGFDPDLRLVSATGPVNLAPFGEGELEARFTDFRRTRGYLLPFRTAWAFRGARLADERALAICPNDPAVRPAIFAAPGLIPPCDPG